MDIQSTSHGVSLAAKASLPKALLNLRLGQQISATVIKQFVETGQLVLQLSGKQIRAESNVTVPPGRALLLEVVKLGEQPQLKIVNLTPAANTTGDALRANLGNQKSPIGLSQQLISLVGSDPELSRLPKPLRLIARNLLQALPQISDLTTPNGLKRAILNSGIFLEAKLAAFKAGSNSSVNADLKANILRLINHTESTLKSHGHASQKQANTAIQAHSVQSQVLHMLQEQAKGALSKIVIDQLASLPEDGQQKQTWSLELPFLNKQQSESAQVVIKRETSRAAISGESQWSIIVELQPPNLGTIQSKITVTEQFVNTSFRTERNDTNQLIQDNLAKLRDQFNQSGLTPGDLGSKQGRFDNQALPKLSSSIVDETA